MSTVGDAAQIGKRQTPDVFGRFRVAATVRVVEGLDDLVAISQKEEFLRDAKAIGETETVCVFFSPVTGDLNRFVVTAVSGATLAPTRRQEILDALAFFEDASTLMKKVIEKRASAGDRHILAWMLTSHAGYLERAGRRAGALAKTREGNHFARLAYDESPRNEDYRSLVFEQCLFLSGLYRELGELNQSTAAAEEAYLLAKGKPEELYRVAVELAQCALKLKNAQSLSAKEKATTSDLLALGSKVLRDIVAAKYRTVQELRNDPALTPLYSLKDASTQLP